MISKAVQIGRRRVRSDFSIAHFETQIHEQRAYIHEHTNTDTQTKRKDGDLQSSADREEESLENWSDLILKFVDSQTL